MTMTVDDVLSDFHNDFTLVDQAKYPQGELCTLSEFFDAKDRLNAALEFLAGEIAFLDARAIQQQNHGFSALSKRTNEEARLLREARIRINEVVPGPQETLFWRPAKGRGRTSLALDEESSAFLIAYSPRAL